MSQDKLQDNDIDNHDCKDDDVGDKREKKKNLNPRPVRDHIVAGRC